MDAPQTDPRMTVWPALLLAPLLALGHLSLAYSLVTPSCAHQDSAGLHGLSAFSLVLALLMTALAWRSWSRHAPRRDAAPAGSVSDASDEASRPHFVALVSTLTGALSSLVILAMWLPVWLLPPCT
jgi:hypothetical protein